MNYKQLESIIGQLAEENRKVAEAQRKSEEERRKTEEVQRKTKATMDALGEDIRNLIAARRISEEIMHEERRKTEAEQRELRRQLGGIHNSQGEIAEDLFSRNVVPLCAREPYRIEFKHIYRRFRLINETTGYTNEFDVCALNGEVVLLVEVKVKLGQKEVDAFLEKLAQFRARYYHFKGHRIIGAVAGLTVSTEVERYAGKRGLLVFTQTDDGGATIANSTGFVPSVY